MIDANLQLVRGLVAVVGYTPEITQAQFARLGARLMTSSPEIRRIVAAPDLVVSMVYPVRGNEAIFGMDFSKREEQLRAGLLARDLRTTLISGPMDLSHGGRSFIARTPVFTEDSDLGAEHFWGLLSTVIDEAALYSAAGLTDPDLPLDVALVGRNGQVEGGETFFGDPGILGNDPVTATVQLPYGGWQIAAVPRGGWAAPGGFWTSRLLFAMAGLLLLAPVIGAAELAASRQSKLGLIRDREAELSRLSWRLEFALKSSKVGVWDADLATDELLWDDRAKEIFGFSDRSGVFGEKDWTGAVHPEDRERVVAEALSAASGSRNLETNYRIVRPDGEVRHIRDMASLYEGEDGSRRLVGLVWDVTPDVERQEELNLRRLEAEAATGAKSRFLAAMSHEIRTPMSGVLGLLRLMLDEQLPSKQRERAGIALASAESLLEILNDILDFSKLEAQQIRISEEPVDVRQLVDEVLALMAAGAEQKGLALGQEVSARVPSAIVTDPMRLRQVLTNLVSNATKFTDRGEVTVRVDHEPGEAGGRLRVEVEDTGIGIAEAQREQIFQHFVQADDALNRRAGGTGLGLAISRQLVELMGGTIGVRSVPGMGSTFAFDIVAAPAAAPVQRAPVHAMPPREAAAARGLRVLLAEDHATNQYLINAYLRGAGHEVTVVDNGRAAIAAAAEGGFDVILMDVQMPEIDGLAATRAIRALDGPGALVPIIALTANAMPEDRQGCFEAGMTDYLAKPVDVAALHAALYRVRVAAETDAPRRSAAG